MQNPISRRLNSIVDNWFDKWTGVHFLACLSIMWTLQWFNSSLEAGLRTFFIAFTWEVYEAMTEGIEPYGSHEAYWRNTISDMLVTIFCIAVLWQL